MKSDLDNSQRFRLVTLDLDGTLFQTDSVLYLKDKLALGEEVAKLHSQYRTGEITEAELNSRQTPLLQRLELTPVLKVLSTGPLLSNIRKGVDALKSSGLGVSMLTFNPLQVFFEREFGIDTSISRTVEIRDDMIVKINKIPENKIEYLTLYCDLNGIALEECVHVGDGPNDIPTFRAVGFSVALNSKYEEVKNAADISLETDDFALVANEILERNLSSGRPFSQTPSSV